MIADFLVPMPPSGVHLAGWLGARVAASEKNRLLAVDLAPLLAGFQQRPGSHPWIGEHIGKWLHAATLAWQNTGDTALKVKIDSAARDLIACQEPDGYLGTYVKDKRFGLYPGADWDVWVHKYCLIGLLTYAEYAKDRAAALHTCRRIGDLLCATFGPGRKSILSAGTHVGMAATSVLEPMVLLTRMSREPRYLAFCRHIVDAWDEPGGPRILATLTRIGKVNRTANGKAYEMLSNLVGLCELYRETGERRYLVPVVRAWEDIRANQLYLTGTASHFEHFAADHDLPNAPRFNIGETCVTVTWLQMNLQLLRLTGEARYGHEIERLLYNHLAAAQRPDGREWCYYTPLEGSKPYGPGISCCVSSGPRGMALAPQTACFRSGDSVVINTLDPFEATTVLGNTSVRMALTGPFPAGGTARLTLRPERPARFGLRLRVPLWTALNVTSPPGAQLKDGWLIVPPRDWAAKETTVRLDYAVTRRVVPGEYGNTGKSAFTVGPFVLARAAGGGSEVFFADAGSHYRVWGGDDSAPDESQSREGNVVGSLADGDPKAFVVTFDGTSAAEDWYALSFPHPVTTRRILFAHGHRFHDGGWFDSSRGKPRIEVKNAPASPWVSVGELTTYPDTTAGDAKDLKDGRLFALELPAPITVSAVRVVGRPACGDNPTQAFSSCGEIIVEPIKRVSPA